MHNYSLTIRRIKRFLSTGTYKSRPYRDYVKHLTSLEQTFKKGFINITIDLELGWSRARRGDTVSPTREALKRSQIARATIREFLDLCNTYKIPITFAIIGHLATTDCSSHQKPPAYKPYWMNDDWYAIDPCSRIEENKDFYGFDLVEDIINSKVNHEIASHGFSHVDLSDESVNREVAQFEIAESFRILKTLDKRLAIFVYPNNNVAFTSILKDAGYLIYRTKTNHKIKQDEYGLWQFPVGLWLSPYSFSSKEAIDLVKLAIKEKKLVNFYFHLYEFKNKRKLKKYFQPIFQFIRNNKEKSKIEATTVRDLVNNYLA